MQINKLIKRLQEIEGSNKDADVQAHALENHFNILLITIAGKINIHIELGGYIKHRYDQHGCIDDLSDTK